MKKLIGQVLFILIAATFAEANVNNVQNAEAVPGEFVVKLKNYINVKSANTAALSQQLGSYVKTTIPNLNIVVIKRPVFEIQSEVIKLFKENGNIEIIEPNFIYRINQMPNDPTFPQLWGLKNYGQADSTGQVGVVGVDINAEKAWSIETGSKDVLVAVIDTGVNYNHPDLVDNIWTNEAEANGVAGVDDDKNGFVDDIHGYNFVNNKGDAMDDHGHGSHCAGTIGGKGNDGKGIVGVAWNTKIMGVKFLGASGGGTLDAALKAIDYATVMGAKIMSNSWGGGGYSETLKAAIERSHAAGAVFVAAAGNDFNNNDVAPSYPANYDTPNVISVAAIDNQGKLAKFSNFGKKTVHVGAPGVNVYSSTLGVGYNSWSGTSMACPHVSGVAALLASHEPELTNVEIKQRIISSVKPMKSLRNRVASHGMVDAYMALANEQAPPNYEDPANWKFIEVQISTVHPYENKKTVEFEINVPEAKEIAIYFDKFDIEQKFDIAEIYDTDGQKIQTLTGNMSESFSEIVKGNYAKIIFHADSSVNGYGFDISKVAYR